MFSTCIPFKAILIYKVLYKNSDMNTPCRKVRKARRGSSSLLGNLPLSRHPRPSIHRTLLLGRCRPYPLQQTMHMEYVTALSPDQWTIVSGHLARWATAFVWDTAYTTDITLAVVVRVGGACVPTPLCNSMPVFHVYLHGAGIYGGGIATL